MPVYLRKSSRSSPPNVPGKCLSRHISHDLFFLKLNPQFNREHARWPTKSNIEEKTRLGWKLWKSVYFPHDTKLYEKLADSHPDLPAFIVAHEYGALFADPERHDKDLSSVIRHAKVGRVLTSLVAIACLRAQTGVGPQVCPIFRTRFLIWQAVRRQFQLISHIDIREPLNSSFVSNPVVSE